MHVAVAIAILAGASLVLLAAAWFADQAGRHARDAAACLRDTKAAIAKWALDAGIPFEADAASADMADALAERRHWTAGGK